MAKYIFYFTASPNTFLDAKLVYKPKFDSHPKPSFICACVLQKKDIQLHRRSLMTAMFYVIQRNRTEKDAI